MILLLHPFFQSRSLRLEPSLHYTEVPWTGLHSTGLHCTGLQYAGLHGGQNNGFESNDESLPGGGPQGTKLGLFLILA